MARSVDETFPHLTAWVLTHGWIEIGYDDYHRSFIRALDSGGTAWEGRMVYSNLDSALQALDTSSAAGRNDLVCAEKIAGDPLSLRSWKAVGFGTPPHG
jgi:hypothetical protein